MISKIRIARDEQGHKIVLLPEIIFKNKQNINWKAVEQYLKRCIGEVVIIAESGELRQT